MPVTLKDIDVKFLYGREDYFKASDPSIPFRTCALTVANNGDIPIDWMYVFYQEHFMRRGGDISRSGEYPFSMREVFFGEIQPSTTAYCPLRSIPALNFDASRRWDLPQPLELLLHQIEGHTGEGFFFARTLAPVQTPFICVARHYAEGAFHHGHPIDPPLRAVGYAISNAMTRLYRRGKTLL